MKQQIKIILALLILMLFIASCATVPTEESKEESENDISEDISEIDTLQKDMDISELEDIEKDLSEIGWEE